MPDVPVDIDTEIKNEQFELAQAGEPDYVASDLRVAQVEHLELNEAGQG